MSPRGAEAGDLIAGKYRVVCQLGEGGMGVVLLAVHEALGVKVAIKVLNREGRTGADEKRFALEAQTAAQLKSEHVARVTDVGTLGDGRQYMVMEHLEGETLASRLARRGRLPSAEAVDFVVQTCAGLAEAHASGIVHRDIKPSNLFLTRRSDGALTIKVLDFGISKFQAGPRPQALTSTGLAVGTPLYMSPEQVKHAKTIDARSDIWSLGVVLYELLTGKSPFEDESLGVTLVNVLEKPHPAVRAQGTDVDPALAAVVDACLAKDPADRPPSVVTLAEQLAPFAGEEAQRLAARIGKIAERATARVQVSLPAEVSRAEGSPTPPVRPTPSADTPPEMPTTVQMSLPSARRASDSDGARFAGHTPAPEPLVTAAPPRPERSAPWVVAAAGLLAIGAVIWFVASRGGPGTPSPAAQGPEAPASQTAAAPVVTAEPPPRASADAPATSSATAMASATGTAPAKRASSAGSARLPSPTATATAEATAPAATASTKQRTLH